ncbi:MAG: glycosyltransferase [Pseudomonadota bacterium]
MACARPVLAATDSSSELSRLIANAGCGAVVPPASAAAIADVIRSAHRNPETWRNMGLAGWEHVVHHYARHRVTDRYHALVGRLALPSDRRPGQAAGSVG